MPNNSREHRWETETGARIAAARTLDEGSEFVTMQHRDRPGFLWASLEDSHLIRKDAILGWYKVMGYGKTARKEISCYG